MDLLQWRDQAQPSSSYTSEIALANPRTIASFLTATNRLELYEEGRLNRLQKLGSGSYFEVHACRDEKTGKILAVKTLKRRSHTSRIEIPIDDEILQQLKVSIHPPLLNHPNITILCGIEEPHWSGRHYTLSLVSEYSEIGSIARLFEDDSPIPEVNDWRQRKAFAFDVVSGLEALHSCRVIHADLKPENVLLFKNMLAPPNAPLTAKLSDFGNSIVEDTVFVEDLFKGKRLYHGTPVYVAPFVREAHGDIPFHVLPKCDIYSLGLLIWSIFKNQHYFLATGESLNDIDDETLMMRLTETDILRELGMFCHDLKADLGPEETGIFQRAVMFCIKNSPIIDRSPLASVVREQVLRDVFSEVSSVKAILKNSGYVNEKYIIPHDHGQRALLIVDSLISEAEVIQQPFGVIPYTFSVSTWYCTTSPLLLTTMMQ
jgi:serine/threonine protein kinase